MFDVSHILNLSADNTKLSSEAPADHMLEDCQHLLVMIPDICTVANQDRELPGAQEAVPKRKVIEP